VDVALARIRDVISDLFWLVATAQVAIAIGLVVRLRRLRVREVADRHFALATGQRQDSWLAAAVVWAVILGKGTELHEPLCLVGSAVLGWLILRSLRRLAIVIGWTHRRGGR